MKLLTLKWKDLRKIIELTDVKSIGDRVLIDDDGFLYNNGNPIPVGKIPNSNILHLKNIMDKQGIECYEWLIETDSCEKVARMYLNTNARYTLYDFFITHIGKSKCGNNKIFLIVNLMEYLAMERKEANAILKHLMTLGFILPYENRKRLTQSGYTFMKKELDEKHKRNQVTK